MKLIKIFIFVLLPIGFIYAQNQKISTEEILLKNGTIELPGTLSYQEIKEDTPLVIFVPGSGNTDRNGNQTGTNVKADYIKQLAIALNEKSIAFYRYDKRSATPKNLEQIIKAAHFDDLVDDVKIIISHFKKQNRFKKIILIGHSQGSLVAMLAINDPQVSVNRYVSLAGLSETVEKAIIRQIKSQNAEFGIIAAAHFKELKETDTILEVNPLLAGIFNPVNHEFLKSYNAYNPIEESKKVKVSTLIINGDSDLQVRVEDAKALHATNTNATMAIIPKMNHVLKEINNLQENQASYFSEKFTLSPMLIDVLVDFIKK